LIVPLLVISNINLQCITIVTMSCIVEVTHECFFHIVYILLFCSCIHEECSAVYWESMSTWTYQSCTLKVTDDIQYTQISEVGGVGLRSHEFFVSNTIPGLDGKFIGEACG